MICIGAPSEKKISGEINLPRSKSISNRMLIIEALSDGKLQIQNLSDANDTRILKSVLDNPGSKINVEDAGTAMRFLTAYFATKKGTWIIEGNDRMNFRPIGPLVDALTQLGANIEYLDKDGYPPIKIKGGNLAGKEVSIKADMSSQFISALMMIGPALKDGLVIKLVGKVLSFPYIKMTAGLMRLSGIHLEYDKKEVKIWPGSYKKGTVSVEPDWSAASYWYELAAMCESAEIKLNGLRSESLQGDNVLMNIFNRLGVATEFTDKGLTIRKTGLGFSLPETFQYNFSDCPDLAQTLAVTCAALNIPAKLEGLSNLPLKETDRIQALIDELAKMGVSVVNLNNEGIGITPHRGNLNLSSEPIKTYNDHRMAMAFSPVAMKTKSICLDRSNVIEKSYPNYWNDLKKFNFTLYKIS